MEKKDHHKRIIFFGDSYAANMHKDHYMANGQQEWQGMGDKMDMSSACHPSIVADHFDLELANFAYAGKSWWYSRQKMQHAIDNDYMFLDRTFAMVFFHTNWQRINCSQDLGANVIPHSEHLYKDSEEIIAQNLHFKYIADDSFQHWTGENWYREINRRFSHIPVINFFCFREEQEYMSLLPGRKFTTPLITLSVAELTGTDKEIMGKISWGETRANHFSPHNNRAMAQVIIRALENYEDITGPIDYRGFDLPNPNGLLWPKRGFGTR